MFTPTVSGQATQVSLDLFSSICTGTPPNVVITASASYAGDSNYNAASDVARSFNIAKASASVVLSNLSQTYDGTAKSATATTTPGGLSVVTYTPTTQAALRKNPPRSTPSTRAATR